MTKWLALVFMLIDHSAIAFESLLSNNMYWVMRGLGRLSFPLFTYFLILGLDRTSNLKKYLIRMFTFGILTEFMQRTTLVPIENHTLNVMFSLTIYGLLYAIFADKLKEHISNSMKLPIAFLLLILIATVDYSYSGLLMFIGLSWLNKSNLPRKHLYASVVIFISFAPGILLGMINPLQLWASLAGLLMFAPKLENRIFNPKFEKWIFYLIYPVQWVMFDVIIGILGLFYQTRLPL